MSSERALPCGSAFHFGTMPAGDTSGRRSSSLDSRRKPILQPAILNPQPTPHPGLIPDTKKRGLKPIQIPATNNTKTSIAGTPWCATSDTMQQTSQFYMDTDQEGVSPSTSTEQHGLKRLQSSPASSPSFGFKHKKSTQLPATFTTTANQDNPGFPQSSSLTDLLAVSNLSSNSDGNGNDVADDKFIYVNKRRRRANSFVKTFDSSPPVPLTNSFAPLSTDEPTPNSNNNNNNLVHINLDNNINTSNNNNNNFRTPPNPKETSRKMKIPAIKIKASNWGKFYKNLFAECKIQPSAYLYGQNMIQLNCSTLDDYKASLAFLKSNKIEHFTFCLQSEKKPQMVIRGLSITESPVEIKNALTELNINVETVTQICTTRPLPSELELGITSINPPRPTPVFIVLLSSPSELIKFTKITHLFGVQIKIHPFQKPKEPVQCTNCLAIGHTSNYCTMAPKCKKCGLQHHHTTCNKPKEDIKCINCGQDHSALYKGCPLYVKAKNALRQRIATAQNKRASPPTLNLENFPNLPQKNAWPTSINSNTTNENTGNLNFNLSNILGLDINQFLQNLVNDIITQITSHIQTFIANFFKIQPSQK